MVPFALFALSLATIGDDRVWDQAKAVAKVQQVIEVEKRGRPWDETAWLTDPAKALDRARAERKPVFVFFYLAKPVGPPSAPC